MRYRYYLILFVAFLSMQCTPEPQKIGEVSIIPKPLEVTIQEGNFVFEGEIYLTTNFAFHQPVQVLREFLYNNLNITTTDNYTSQGNKEDFSHIKIHNYPRAITSNNLPTRIDCNIYHQKHTTPLCIRRPNWTICVHICDISATRVFENARI